MGNDLAKPATVKQAVQLGAFSVNLLIPEADGLK
jgi:hypothetical protein